MAKNEIIKKVTKPIVNDLTSADKVKLGKGLVDATVNAINSNTKDYEELCEVAKKELEVSKPSDEYYKFLQKGLDLHDKAMDKATTVEEREKILQEADELVKKAEENEKIRVFNNKDTTKKVFEKDTENKQYKWALIKTLGIVTIAIAGCFLGKNENDIAGKLINKK